MLGAGLRRLGGLLLTVFGVSVLTFAAVWMIPGDAVQVMLGANAEVSDAQLAAARVRLGLDGSAVSQYVRWLWRALHGDFGSSVLTGQPVLAEIVPRIAVTAEVTILAVLLAGALAIPLGCLMATTQSRAADAAVRVASIAGITVPSFWLGTMLLYGASVLAPGVAPPGWVDFASDPMGNLRRVVLPVLALALPALALLARVVRAAMLDAMKQDYVRTARAKGLAPRAVVGVHALRNALLPFLTNLGVTAGYLFGGSVVVEQVFALPGLGRLVVGAVAERNVPLVQAVVLLATIVFVGVNAAVDLLCVAADPRLRR